jgi:hypothetical protein
MVINTKKSNFFWILGYTIFIVVALVMFFSLATVRFLPQILATERKRDEAARVASINSSIIISGIFQITKEERSKVIAELMPAVIEEVKSNPSLIQEFFPEIVSMVVKDDAMSAIRIENYASQRIKEEMAELRKDASVEQLAQKSKSIAELTTRISDLEGEVNGMPQLKKEISRLRDANTDMLRLREQIKQQEETVVDLKSSNANTASLRHEIEALKKENSSLTVSNQHLNSKVDELSLKKKEKKESSFKPVPVAIGNTWLITSVSIKIIDKNGKFFSHFLGHNDKDRVKIISLLPGSYSVEFYTFSGGDLSQKAWRTINVTVTDYPSVDFGKETYHGLILTPK